MPLALTQRAARIVERRVRQAARAVREEWSNRERRARRIEAFRRQSGLARALAPVPAGVR